MTKIIPYLKYLREMSRKIIINRGFENVLYRKPKGQQRYYSVYEKTGSNEWDRIAKHLAEVGNRKAFLGIGLCAGRFLRKGGHRRFIAAPLLFVPIEVGLDDESKDLFEYIDWGGLCFNYDLISILTATRDEEEMQSPKFNLSFEEKEIYQKFSKLESQIDDAVNNGKIDDFLTKKFCNEMFDRMSELISTFKSAKKHDTEPNENNLNELLDECMKQNQLSFFNHRFVFVANVPDELTAYAALRELIQQVE